MTTKLQDAFFDRVGLPRLETVAFEDLAIVLIAMGRRVPFENLDIIEGRVKPISRENLHRKIVTEHRGGLCYELNPMLNYFLKDSGFDVRLVAGTVYDSNRGEWMMDENHVTNVLLHEGKLYLVDTGFGSMLALAPVPFTGETIKSQAGEYRVREKTTDKGSHMLEIRKAESFAEIGAGEDWVTAYAFSLEEIGEVELNRIQKIIAEDDASIFNKTPLVARLIENGHISLTNETFNITRDGVKTKETIPESRYPKILEEQFGLVR